MKRKLYFHFLSIAGVVLGLATVGHATPITHEFTFTGAGISGPVSDSLTVRSDNLRHDYSSTVTANTSASFTGSLQVTPQVPSQFPGQTNIQVAFNPFVYSGPPPPPGVDIPTAGNFSTAISGSISPRGFILDGTNIIPVAMPSKDFTSTASERVPFIPSFSQLSGGVATGPVSKAVYNEAVSQSFFSTTTGNINTATFQSTANLNHSHTFNPEAISGKILVTNANNPGLKGEQPFTITRAFRDVSIPLGVLPGGQWNVKIEDLSLKASAQSNVSLDLTTNDKIVNVSGQTVSSLNSNDRLTLLQGVTSAFTLTPQGDARFPDFSFNTPFGATEPGTILLIGSGLVGLVGWRRYVR